MAKVCWPPQSPFIALWMTRAPKDSAIPFVRSVLKSSMTRISSENATLAMQSAMFLSSFFAKINVEIFAISFPLLFFDTFRTIHYSIRRAQSLALPCLFFPFSVDFFPGQDYAYVNVINKLVNELDASPTLLSQGGRGTLSPGALPRGRVFSRSGSPAGQGAPLP